MVYRLGPVALTRIDKPWLLNPSLVERIVNVTLPVARFEGSCASISVGDVDISGMVTSFAVTHTPPSCSGNGEVFADAASARFVPRIEINPPAARAPLWLGVFTT